MNTFHISLPVKDFAQTQTFYCDVLGGEPSGCSVGKGFNVLLHGHQLTFHVQPEQILTSAAFHWGLQVDWNLLHSLFTKLQTQNIPFALLPKYQQLEPQGERVKMQFYDPNGYLLEYKAYRQLAGEELPAIPAKMGKKPFWHLWQGAFTPEMCWFK